MIAKCAFSLTVSTSVYITRVHFASKACKLEMAVCVENKTKKCIVCLAYSLLWNIVPPPEKAPLNTDAQCCVYRSLPWTHVCQTHRACMGAWCMLHNIKHALGKQLVSVYVLSLLYCQQIEVTTIETLVYFIVKVYYICYGGSISGSISRAYI